MNCLFDTISRLVPLNLKIIWWSNNKLMEKKEINELVINRLKKERKEWRSDHPFGFVAKPIEANDGSLNMLKWHC